MNCRICGANVDDPFWDDLCPECEHDLYHRDSGGVAIFPGCSFCITEAEDEDLTFGQGDDEYERAF